MKMVISESDHQYLIELKERLIINGIPAVIQGENTGRIIPLAFFRGSLWIYVDSQYDEALALINDPDYVVKNQIDPEMIHNSQAIDPSSNAKNLAYSELVLFFIKIAIAMVALIMLLRWL